MRQPTPTELEYILLTPAQKKDALSYLNFRARRLEALYRKDHPLAEIGREYLFGRLVEARQVRDFVKHLITRKKGG